MRWFAPEIPKTSKSSLRLSSVVVGGIVTTSIVTAVMIAAALTLPLPSAVAKTTITVYLRESIPVEYEWEKRVIADFEKKNPDIDVQIVTETGSTYDAKLLTLWATGNPPDVWDHGGTVNTYFYNDWLLDLGPYVRRDAAEINAADFFPAAWRAYRDGDKQWGMPFVSVGSFTWYNTDLLDAAGLQSPAADWNDTGWTWQRVQDYARKLTTYKPNGPIERAGLVIIHWSYLDIQYSWSFGGDWFDETAWRQGVPSRPTFDTPANREAYQTMVDMLYRQRVAITFENTTTDYASNLYPTKQFTGGNAAMAVGEGPWLVMGQLDGIKFRWGMAPFPRGGQTKNYTSMVYTDPWMISSKAKNPEAAWKFVKYITSAEVMKDYVKIGNFAPARKSAVLDYVNRLSQASRHHSAAEVLLALAGSQEYGREALDHVIVGWSDFFQEIQGRMPAIWGNTRAVPVVLKEIDEAVTRLIQRKFPTGSR
ncbi:MAG: ABC transporter substrate-binding protein [Bacteroidota bacterium]